MPLPRDFYVPFDITYNDVTRRIYDYSETISDLRTRSWLETLVRGFLDERRNWPSNPLDEAPTTYREYMMLASRLRWRILHLTACAYLHISYDLPRVIADEWPNTGSWATGPDQKTGQYIYFDLRPIFSSVLHSVAKRRAVMGIPALFLSRLPNDIVGILSHWVLVLRASAWMHAQRLQSAGPQRTYIEAKMMEAMIAALSHVQNSRPWPTEFLAPPDDAVFSSIGAWALTFDEISKGVTALNVILLMANALLLWWIYRLLFWSLFRRDKLQDLGDFIDEFGWRVSQYVAAAVRDPEDLDRFLEEMAPPGGKRPDNQK